MMDHYRDELEQHARGCQLPVGNCTDCTTLENFPPRPDDEIDLEGLIDPDG